MLVLTRGNHQEVIITLGDEQVIVTLVEVRGDKVRLGFTAESAVKINRAEIQERIDADRYPPSE